MKYRIEIWQYQNITETYESDSIENILEWYKVNWWWVYEIGGCSFHVYKDDEEISWREEYKLGFHS